MYVKELLMNLNLLSFNLYNAQGPDNTNLLKRGKKERFGALWLG